MRLHGEREAAGTVEDDFQGHDYPTRLGEDGEAGGAFLQTNAAKIDRGICEWKAYEYLSGMLDAYSLCCTSDEMEVASHGQIKRMPRDILMSHGRPLSLAP